MIGAGVAWELAAGGAEVVLLEADEIASGASGGLGKRFVRANARDLRELPLMRIAYELWPSLEDRIGAPTGYERIGSLQMIERQMDYDSAPARAWAQERQGIPTQVLTGEEVREMEPYANGTILGATYCPDDGVADHTVTTRNLARAARRLGAVVREQTPVRRLERDGDRVAAVITEGEERIPVGKRLLLTSNANVADLLRSVVSVTLPLWTLLPQTVLTEPVTPMPVRRLALHAHRRVAIKSVPGGRVNISGGWRGRWNPETGRGEIDEDQVRGNLAEAIAVYPSLDGVHVQRAAADRPESYSADGIPIIDYVPGIVNTFFATAWSGHGWAIAPAVWGLLANWARTGEASPMLRPFRYNRFFGDSSPI